MPPDTWPPARSRLPWHGTLFPFGAAYVLLQPAEGNSVKLYQYVAAGTHGKWELVSNNARPQIYNRLEDSSEKAQEWWVGCGLWAFSYVYSAARTCVHSGTYTQVHTRRCMHAQNTRTHTHARTRMRANGHAQHQLARNTPCAQTPTAAALPRAQVPGDRGR